MRKEILTAGKALSGAYILFQGWMLRSDLAAKSCLIAVETTSKAAKSGVVLQ